MIAVIPAGQQTGAADQSADHIRHNAAVQIRRDHNIELMWFGDQLHAAIVDDHVVVLDFRVLLGHLPRRLQEQAV